MGIELPPMGFDVKDAGYQAPAADGSTVQVVVAPDSKRLQLLDPFAPWDGKNIEGDAGADQGCRKVYNRPYLHGRSMVALSRTSG